jgi:hypothetical protein
VIFVTLRDLEINHISLFEAVTNCKVSKLDHIVITAEDDLELQPISKSTVYETAAKPILAYMVLLPFSVFEMISGFKIAQYAARRAYRRLAVELVPIR